MKKVFLYLSPDGESPFLRFLSVMEPKLRTKLVQGIGNLAAIPEYRTEPHVKHFSLERYAALYEYRARMRIMVRVIFTLDGDGNIILLHPMVKKRDRNTMQALDDLPADAGPAEAGGGFSGGIYWKGGGRMTSHRLGTGLALSLVLFALTVFAHKTWKE